MGAMSIATEINSGENVDKMLLNTFPLNSLIIFLQNMK
jgi:hypothetical protein